MLKDPKETQQLNKMHNPGFYFAINGYYWGNW